MNKLVERPKATGTRINCYEEFELCYLRHKYLRKSGANPTEAQIKPFNYIINLCTTKTYYTYIGLFQSIGMDWEDIVSIGKTHLVSYLGLFSMQTPEKLDKFIDRIYEDTGEAPTLSDILDKDKADFTMFLKQRMEDLVRICRQKVKNIRGQLADEFLVFYGPEAPPDDHNKLIKGYGKLGFKKLDATKFKTLKRKQENKQEGPVYEINGLFYVTIRIDHRQLTIHDLIGAGLNPYDNIHNMNPEDIMLQIATEVDFQKNKEKWEAEPRHKRIKKIRDFIIDKGNDPRYTEEVNTARRMIKWKKIVENGRK